MRSLVHTCTALLAPSLPQFSLLMSQPSLCNGSVSWWWDMLTQRPGVLLRWTTFVEIMAPTWDMGFFTDVIRHQLFATNFGRRQRS